MRGGDVMCTLTVLGAWFVAGGAGIFKERSGFAEGLAGAWHSALSSLKRVFEGGRKKGWRGESNMRVHMVLFTTSHIH